MALIVVEADLRNLFKYQEAVAQFGTGGVRQIAAWTMNQVGDRMRTQVARSLVQQTGLKYGEVRDQLFTTPATPFALEYIVKGSGRYFGVGHFHAVGGGGGRGQGPRFSIGVVASPWNRRQAFRGAFLVGAGRVFVRKGPERLPIKFLYGPSVPREMERDAVPQDFIEAAENALPGAIDKKLNQMLPW